MTDRFDVTYPPKGEITFDGGMNSKYSRALIAENQSPDCLNVTSDGNAVGTRGGTQKFNSVSVGTFACDGLFTRHASTGTESMVAWFGGTFYQASNTTFVTVPSGQSIWTAGVKVSAAEYENYLFMGNGYTVPMKWNGTSLTRHGVYPPTSVPTYSSFGASGSTGAANGTYYYKITNVNSSSVEGNPSSNSTAMCVACQTVNLSEIIVGPASYGVSARRIYRTKGNSGVSSTYYRIAEIADNTTTVYADTAADSALVTAAPSDNGVPPKYNAIIQHGDRLFCNDVDNPSFLWYSEVGEPFTWSLLNFILVGDATADLLRSFQIQDDTLIMGCDKSVFTLYMPDSSDDSTWLPPKRTRSGYGCKSPRGMFRFGNRVGFPALENFQFMGFAAIRNGDADTSETLLTTSSIASDLISDPIEPDMMLVPENMVERINSMVFEGKAYITIAYGVNQTTNNRVYVLDFTREALDTADKSDLAWYPWSYASLAPGPMTVFNNSLYFGTDSTTGFVYKMNFSTYSDDGAAIDSYYTTKEFSGRQQDINTTKDFRRFELLYQLVGSYYMSVGYRTDSSSGDFLLQNISVTPGGSLWGTFTWGVNQWSAGFQEGESTIFQPASRGKRIQFSFTNQNTAGQQFQVIRMKFSYNNKGRR